MDRTSVDKGEGQGTSRAAVLALAHRHRARPGQDKSMQIYPIGSPLESVTSLFRRPQSPPSDRTDLHDSSSSSSSSSTSSYLPAPLRTALSSHTGTAVLSSTGAVALTALTFVGYRRYWRRIRSAEYVTQGMLDGRRWVRGVVTSVGDGDNFRVFHTPLGYNWPFTVRKIPGTAKELKDQTIHIRIAGVDAPECAHFGRPAQPHSAESLAWLRNELLGNPEGTMPVGGGKSVWVRLLRRDQYGRIVGSPFIRRWFWRDIPLPLLMLQKGMAVVYESSGAEYGKWGIEEMKRVEQVAKDQRVGLWALPPSETPAEYKKRYRVGEVDTPPTSRAEEAVVRTGSLLSRVMGRWFRSEVWRGK